MSTPETRSTPEHSSPGVELKEMLAALEHNKPPPIMTPCVEPGTLGTVVSVQSNAYGIVVDKENHVFVYDIRIYSEITATKTVEFTKKGKDDCLVNERKEKAITVLDTLILQQPQQFPDKFKVYYDGQSMLFTLFDIFNGTEERARLFPIDPTTLPDLTSLPNIYVNIKAAEKKSFFLSPEAVASKTANSDLRDNERYISQFLEIAFNEYAVRNPERHKVYEQGKTYMCHPENEGFTPRDCPQVGDGKQLKTGSQKSIRQCEGPLGRGTNNSSLIIDSKKAPFHTPINCVEKMKEICGPGVNYDAEFSIRHLDKLKSIFKGLYIATTHLKRNKKLRVSNIAQTTALNSHFTLPSGDVTVAEYFSMRYGIVLKYPRLPLLVIEERGQSNVYPAEVCQVVPYQRVTVPQTTSQQSQMTTKACVVPPLVRQSNIVKGAKALEVFGEDNQYIANAGLQLCRQPMKVLGRQLPAMAISVVGNDNIPVLQGQWKMRGGYLVPATCNVWAAYMVEDAHRYSHDEFVLFVKRFFEECRHKGMHLPNPTEIKTLSSRDIQERLKVAKENQCEFAFIVVADELDDLHSKMKLWEREMVMVTQHVKTNTMINVMKKNRRATLENIINKTNCKLGGLNYGINVLHINGIASKWFTDQRLVIGISVSMPPPTATFKVDKSNVPLVVGYAANMKSNVFEYVGDFMFQDTNHTKVLGSLKCVVEESVRRHKENHGGQAAEEIVIYRTGVDEGQYGAIISNDVPLVRAQLARMNVNAKVVFIVVQKQHNVRLMRDHIDPNATIANQNLPPGTVNDQELTHPAYKEFFLNSHVTLHGSAKTPRYTVLVDDMDMKMDDIEGMTYALAHDHQIIQGTVSLPAPLYIAQRYAERGRMIFNTYELQQESSSGSSSGQWDDVNKKLSYKGTNLASARVNA